ncbi:hypothetical protein ILUMI_19146, partial [Ignelater luminosus]
WSTRYAASSLTTVRKDGQHGENREGLGLERLLDNGLRSDQEVPGDQLRPPENGEPETDDRRRQTRYVFVYSFGS